MKIDIQPFKLIKLHLAILLLGSSILITGCSEPLSDTTDGRLRYWISTLARMNLKAGRLELLVAN